MSSAISVRVDKRLWEKLRSECCNYARGKWPYPITLSCNRRRKVWCSDNLSKTKKKVYIHFDDFPFLEEIVEMMIATKPDAGRFHMNREKAFLTDFFKNEEICKIELV